MLSSKTKRLLSALAILSVLAAAVCGWLGSSIHPAHLLSTVSDGERVWALDQRKDSYRFYRTDATGALHAQIETPAQSGNTYVSYGDLLLDGGIVYVLGRTASIAGDLILSETVYRCNFEKRRLDAIWQLPVNDARKDTNLAPQIHDGVLFCVWSDYTGKTATARLLQASEGQALKDTKGVSFDIGVGFTDFFAAESGAFAFTTPAGEVYALFPDEKEAKRLWPAGSGGQPIILFANDGENRIYVGGATGVVSVIDLDGSRRAVAAPYATNDTAFFEGLDGVAYQPDGGFTAASANGTALTLYPAEGDMVTLSQFTAPSGRVALWAILGFLGVWAAAALLALLARLFLVLTHGKIPIVTKLLAAFLPILILSLLIMNALVTQIFTRQLVDGQYERLYLLTSQQTATLNAAYVRDMDMSQAFDSVYFYELRAALNVLPDQGAVYSSGGQADADAQQVYNSNYFWLFKLEDGNLVSLICEQDYIGVPVEAMYAPEIVQSFYDAVDTQKSIRADFRDTFGSWTVLLTPVLDNRGDVVGVIETGDTRQSLDYAVAQGAKRLTALNLIVLAGLALLLSGVLVYSLGPLKTLKERVGQISDGNLGVQAPERGNDEVSEITRVFNAMSRNVEFRDKELRATSDGFSRFVPARVFDLLEKPSVIDVHLADQTSVDATVLNCSMDAFDELARQLRSKEMFRLINQVLARLVPVVDETGGLVDRFDRAGLLAIYTGGAEQALNAAVTLCQRVRSSHLEDAENTQTDFHVALSAGPAMIGIVGANQRLEAMTISENTNFTAFLRPLARKYGAAILLSGSAAARIENFAHRYHARTLGFVYLRAQERLERLYDVYDGDDEATRRRKDETRESFEKGVALYCSRQYYDARLLFIEVLKQHRGDEAAKQYLYLCDTRYRQEVEDNAPIYMETY